jgi:hypothetical protein
MDLIYCAGGNKRLANIAIEEGFLYGARSDDIRDLRCNGLIDINWKEYNWESHVNLVAQHKPKYAVVPDILQKRQLEKVLSYAEELKAYCERVIIVPKLHNIIKLIPRNFVIGISVPTSYAGFLPKTDELVDRKVHFLGGSPRQQRELWKHYTKWGIHVTSVDGNSHSKASDYGSYWNGNNWCDTERATIGKYDAFRKSCRGIMKMWGQLGVL